MALLRRDGDRHRGRTPGRARAPHRPPSPGQLYPVGKLARVRGVPLGRTAAPQQRAPTRGAPDLASDQVHVQVVVAVAVNAEAGRHGAEVGDLVGRQRDLG